MLEDVIFYSSLIICMSLGGYYKKIDDIELKRNYGAGLGLLVTCLICGHQVYHSIFLVWGNIIIIKCCDKRYIHQISLAYTWTYLVYLHLNVKGSVYTAWLHQTIALRLVGLAFEIRMSTIWKLKQKPSSSKQLQDVESSADAVNEQRDLVIQFGREPSAVGIISYSYFFIGIHRGPYYRWKVFEDHFHAPFGVLGDCRIITEHKLKKALICCVGFLLLRLKYSPDAYYDDNFYNTFGSESRYLYSLPQMLKFYLHCQTVMMLCTCVCTETGFGVYPAKCLPVPGHGPTSANSLLTLASKTTEVALKQEYNFSLLKCFDNDKVIFGPKMQDTIRGWDMSTRYWFDTYIFKHLLVKGNKEMRSACAFIAWCVWLGPTLQNMILSATLWVYVQLEAEFTEMYNTTGSMKFPWNLGFSIMRMLCLLYLTPCFIIENTSTVFRYYNDIYWVYHFVLLFLLIFVVTFQKLYKS